MNFSSFLAYLHKLKTYLLSIASNCICLFLIFNFPFFSILKAQWPQEPNEYLTITNSNFNPLYHNFFTSSNSKGEISLIFESFNGGIGTLYNKINYLGELQFEEPISLEGYRLFQKSIKIFQSDYNSQIVAFWDNYHQFPNNNFPGGIMPPIYSAGSVWLQKINDRGDFIMGKPRNTGML